MKPTPRNPSFELYRTLVMKAIVAQYFVVNSGEIGVGTNGKLPPTVSRQRCDLTARYVTQD